ncbi:zinc finger protein 236 [Megalops cyprinoides]|uniref:zinc finger protein 236 n=1 Tax=Megalops cyprinoides TaxID=118141 RepID=UPI001864FE7F|nr:zinc finger protein 236 [Megalops cyprinoides]
MSSEFTIDIQLTELGFPEIFQDGAVAKEIPPLPVSADSTRTPVTSRNSQTGSPPSPDIHANSVSQGRVPPIARNSTEKCVNSPTQQITSESTQNADQSHPRPNADVRPSTEKQSNAAEFNSVAHKVNSVVSQMPEAATVLIHSPNPNPKPNTETAKTIAGRRGDRRSSKGVGGSGSTGKQQGRGVKDSTNEAEEDSEETEDSDVSEEEEEEEEEEDEEGEGEDIVSDTSVDGSAEHRCKVCDIALPSLFRLQEHMRLHSGTRPHRCAECGKQFCHLANYRAHLRGHAQAASVRCRVCEASFDSTEKLRLHLEGSHPEKEFYQCDYCKRVFTCLSECQRHVDQHRREPPRHQCPHCESNFRRRKYLLRHMERHTRRRSYLCTDCGQAFARKNVLFRHSFSHLGLLPYTCVRCRRHFRLASLYRRHVCEPERIQCVACLGFFRSQEDFQRHKEETGCWGHQGARGDEIRCMECGQAFQSTEELKKHAGAHQRVLTCSECGKGFRSALLLMSHMGGHAGQRPCLCQHCGLGFPHQQAYDSHRKDCGRVPPAPVAAKKQKDTPSKAPVTTTRTQIAPKDVWKLTLDKPPPPGATLVMLFPTPGSSSSPGLPGWTSTDALSSSQTGDLQVQAPMLQTVGGTASPPRTGTPGASPDSQETLSGAVLPGSLRVPGTTLELQISKATFVQGPEHSVLPLSSAVEDGTQPSGALLPLSTAVGSTLSQVTGRILEAASVPSVADKARVPTAAKDTESTREEANIKREQGPEYDVNMGTVKEERVEEDDMKKKGEIEVRANNMLPGDVLSRLTVESKPVVNQMESRTMLDLKERGETGTPIHLKIELPAHLRSEIASSLGLLQAKKQAGSSSSGWPGLGDLDKVASGPNTLIPMECETRVDEGMNVDEGGVVQGGLAMGEMKEDEGGAFNSVEVEIQDEDVQGEQEMDGEPHECLSCGQIILEGDLVQHYMQHAIECDSSPDDSIPQTTSQPLSSPSPPGTPPRRKLRSRKTS